MRIDKINETTVRRIEESTQTTESTLTKSELLHERDVYVQYIAQIDSVLAEMGALGIKTDAEFKQEQLRKVVNNNIL